MFVPFQTAAPWAEKLAVTTSFSYSSSPFFNAAHPSIAVVSDFWHFARRAAFEKKTFDVCVTSIIMNIWDMLFYLAFILSVRIKRFSLLVDKQVLLHREVSLWSSSCPHTHSDTTCSCQLMVQHLLLGYFTCCFDCTVILKYSSCDVWQNKLHCLNYSGLSILFSCSSSIVVVVCACCTAPKDKWTNENAGSFVWSYTGVRSSDVIIKLQCNSFPMVRSH